MYLQFYDDQSCTDKKRINGAISNEDFKETFESDCWDDKDLKADPPFTKYKEHVYYYKKVNPEFRERLVTVVDANGEESKHTIAIIDGDPYKNGELVKEIGGSIVIESGRFGKLLPEIQLALQGFKATKLRKLVRAKPEYSFIEGAGALRTSPTKLSKKDKKWISKDGNTTKTGRVLKKFIPGLPDKDVQLLARTIDEKNPVIGKMKDFEKALVWPYSAASAIKNRLGSCMHEHGHWETLEQGGYIGPPPTTLPNPQVPWEDGVGPFALMFRPSAKEVHSNEGYIRAMCWPVTLEDGKRTWFIDRVYPANNYARDFMYDFAKLHGFICRQQWEDSRKGGQPAMMFQFVKPLDSYAKMPYWDTWHIHGSDQLIIGSWKKESNGRSVPENKGKCRCICGKTASASEQDFIYVEGHGARFKLCPSCYEKAQKNLQTLHVDDNFTREGITWEFYQGLKGDK